ncbi:ribonuclease P [Methanosarcinales archaeon ex4572_44]|nr:MAG: ribonuclease P [Methanosarcinales archaeon ex4484_138]PHP46212.1 MAG: ribonuclease P [Methanosarcinales archaeon ex4572_44]RLG26760.1 MAG: ribonuclease P protein subunit [Methanosarcinales archaeon]HHI30302.1 ribonuclease P protein component 1 [Candidatus Methanoperedenaceae archaeon]
MKITPYNLIYHELIGLNLAVARSTNPSQERISGMVVGETKNTLMIDTGCGEKQIQKKHNIFHFNLEDQVVSVAGSLLVSRPENRIKKKGKRYKLN